MHAGLRCKICAAMLALSDTRCETLINSCGLKEDLIDMFVSEVFDKSATDRGMEGRHCIGPRGLSHLRFVACPDHRATAICRVAAAESAIPGQILTATKGTSKLHLQATLNVIGHVQTQKARNLTRQAQLGSSYFAHQGLPGQTITLVLVKH